MNHPWLALAALLILAPSAAADITITTINASQPAQPNDGPWTIAVKGAKVRIDARVMGQDASVLTDIAAKQQWILNHTTREFAPFTMKDLQMTLPSDRGQGRFSFQPNGRTKVIAGRNCTGYSPTGTWTMSQAGQVITIRLTGESWVDQAGPGTAEFLAARRAMIAAGLWYEMARDWKPIADAVKELADAGILMEQVLVMTVDAPDAVFEALGRPRSSTFSQTVTAISTDPIPDDRLSVPAAYTPPRPPAIANAKTPGAVPPVVLRRVEPEYPPGAMGLNVHGVVTLACTVLPTGIVGDAKVVKSLWPSLDAAAVAAIKQWRFAPGTVNGQPVPFFLEVTMTFAVGKSPAP